MAANVNAVPWLSISQGWEDNMERSALQEISDLPCLWLLESSESS